jgi:hypothetical protein
LQLSLTPPIYHFDKSAQATTSLTPGDTPMLEILDIPSATDSRHQSGTT